MYRQVKVALVSTIAPLHAVQADEPDISTVVLTSPEDSLRQSMVITFDEPTALTEVELDLAPVVGDSQARS